MLHKLIFDTTSADTMSETHNVGAYLRAGTTGELVTSGDGDSDNVATTFEGLDTRSFMFGYDSSGDNWDRIQQVGGAVKVFIDDGDFEVDVVINAEKAEDAAHSSGDVGNYILAVRSDALPTNANTDADGDYTSFFVNASGELYIHDTDANTSLTSIDSTLTAIAKIEDDAHSSGDAGVMMLAVRNDTLAALADTDGDYVPFQVDADGALYVNIANEISINDAALANTAIANAANTLTAANTAEDVVASPLANRKYLFIYNNDNRELYVGASGVSVADGFPVPPGSILSLRAGAAVDVEWVSEKTGHALRHLELA